MNTKILQKVLEELNKEKPDISYIRGMVEVLASNEEASNPQLIPISLPNQVIHSNIPIESTLVLDEVAILDARARAAVDIVQSLKDNPPME